MVLGSRNKLQTLPEIQGKLLKAVREKKQIKPEDLAHQACLSKKHIIELEEGGIRSFYSEAHKITVAKKIAKLLGIDESRVLIDPDGDAVAQTSLALDVEELSSDNRSPSADALPESSQNNLALEEKVNLENIKSGDIVIWTWWRKEFTEDFKVCKSIRATTVVGLEALQDSNIEADLFIGGEVELPKVEIPKDKKVIVTVGAKGAKFFDSGEISEIPARAADVVDTTGAGDAFAAGFMAKWFENEDLDEAIKYGAESARICIQKVGARPPLVAIPKE